MQNYDIAIIGGGPAGLTAGIYALRANKKVIILEKGAIGGQALYSHEVRNYPGFNYISGWDLIEKMKSQYIDLGGEILISEATSIKLDNGYNITHLHGTINATKVILSMGANARLLGVVGEREYIGKGVSYCATCDGGFFKNKVVAVIGGGDTAFEDILYMGGIAAKIYNIHRSNVYKAKVDLVDRVNGLVSEGKVEMIVNAAVTRISGDTKVKSITLHDLDSGEGRDIEIDAVFVAIGRQPDSTFVEDILTMKNGYIVVDENMRTSESGLYAAGDVTVKPLRQIVTACSDGAIASSDAIK